MCHFEVILELHLPNWSHIWSCKRRKQFILHQNSSLTDAYIAIIDSFSPLPVKMNNSENWVAWKGVNVERQGKGSQVTHQTYRFNLRCLCITQKDSILQSYNLTQKLSFLTGLKKWFKLFLNSRGNFHSG